MTCEISPLNVSTAAVSCASSGFAVTFTVRRKFLWNAGSRSNEIRSTGTCAGRCTVAIVSRPRCVIEVINTAHRDAPGPEEDSRPDGQPFAPPAGPLSPTAEHGRGLQIIDAVVDNVRLTRNNSDGTTVHFEKELDWVPDAAGRQLFSAS